MVHICRSDTLIVCISPPLQNETQIIGEELPISVIWKRSTNIPTAETNETADHPFDKLETKYKYIYKDDPIIKAVHPLKTIMRY